MSITRDLNFFLTYNFLYLSFIFFTFPLHSSMLPFSPSFFICLSHENLNFPSFNFLYPSFFFLSSLSITRDFPYLFFPFSFLYSSFFSPSFFFHYLSHEASKFPSLIFPYLSFFFIHLLSLSITRELPFLFLSLSSSISSIFPLSFISVYHTRT